MSLEAIPLSGLIISVQTEETMSLEELRAFLAARDELGFKARKNGRRYSDGWSRRCGSRATRH